MCNIKKIAIVSDAIYPYNKGGKEKRLHDIVVRLASENCQITVYCMKWWQGGKVVIKDGVTYYAISPFFPLYHGERRSIKEAIFFSLNCFRLFSKKFDIIDVDHMPHLVIFSLRLVCWLKGKRMIATWHEVWGREYWKEYLGIMGELAYLIEKVSAKLPDEIIAVSDFTAKRLRVVLGRSNNVSVVPIGLDIHSILNIQPTQNKTDLVYSGRLLKHKNIDILLLAILKIKQINPCISLRIIGDGPEKLGLEKMAQDMGLDKNVEFTGFIEKHENLLELMKSAKVYVSPSNREGFGIAVNEANACGLPAIIIDDMHNAAKDLIIENENGFLCDLDKNKLAETICRVLKNRKEPEYYEKFANKYEWHNIIFEIKKIYCL